MSSRSFYAEAKPPAQATFAETLAVAEYVKESEFQTAYASLQCSIVSHKKYFGLGQNPIVPRGWGCLNII